MFVIVYQWRVKVATRSNIIRNSIDSSVILLENSLITSSHIVYHFLNKACHSHSLRYILIPATLQCIQYVHMYVKFEINLWSINSRDSHVYFSRHQISPVFISISPVYFLYLFIRKAGVLCLILKIECNKIAWKYCAYIVKISKWSYWIKYFKKIVQIKSLAYSF